MNFLKEYFILEEFLSKFVGYSNLMIVDLDEKVLFDVSGLKTKTLSAIIDCVPRKYLIRRIVDFELYHSILIVKII